MTNPPDREVTLYAEFTARPDTLARVQQLTQAYAERVREEPGNLQFECFLSRENPRRFVVFERYVDDASFDRHLNAPYGADFNSELVGLIEEEESQLTFLTAIEAGES